MMWARFASFFAELKGPDNEPLDAAEHHVQWANAMQEEQKLVLMASRDHGKTFTSLAYLMWRAWRHNRRPDWTWDESNSDGPFEAMMFSATGDQAEKFFGKLQELIVANEHIFADIMPTSARGRDNAIKTAWKNGFVRFRNLASIGIASFGTRRRGVHPQVVVCDDVQDETNSLTKYMRDKTWKYFGAVIMPMLGPDGQLIVIGTAQHYDDLLHRLRDTPEHKTGFAWMKYRAVDWDRGTVLWPARHNLEDLKTRQDFDPLLFAREFQNDPRDDASSYFPMELLNKALEPGAHLTFHRGPIAKLPGVYHVLSADMAMSESAGSDYCVVMVARLELATQKRQVLFAVRERGWGFSTQVGVLRALSAEYDIDLGVIENNSFQRWVAAEVAKFPETAGRIVGHTTGIEKQKLEEGVPSLVVGLNQGLWVMPNGGDAQKDPMAASCQMFAREWASEMNSFGWVNDKMMGVGSHDDITMSFWLLDRACRIVNTLLQQGPPERYVGLKDVGLSRVKIGTDW